MDIASHDNCKMDDTTMTEVLFYHLTKSKPYQTLPILVQKALEKKWRIIIQTTDEEKCNELDKLLWQWQENSFIPHGCITKDKNPEQHPVWITTENENANKAEVRILIDDAKCNEYKSHKRIVRLFEGHNENSLKQARHYWLEEKKLGLTPTYWKQNEKGKFEKQA